MSKIIFKNPFSCTRSYNLPQSYICCNCIYNKINFLGEDICCTLNERAKGDTVTSCGSFKRSKKSLFNY